MIYKSPELLPNFYTPQMPVETFHRLISYTQCLPYERISNPSKPSLVIDEKRGTCSSKHAFLASIAHTHHHLEIELELGIFMIDSTLFPRIKKFGLESFPEAHCYLCYEGQIFDFTRFGHRSFWEMQRPVLRKRILPIEIKDKTKFHRDYLEVWARQHHLSATQVWQAREAFICSATIEK